jgi:hypothetical protein
VCAFVLCITHSYAPCTKNIDWTKLKNYIINENNYTTWLTYLLMPNMKESINLLYCGIEDRTIQCIEICVDSSQDWKFRIYDYCPNKKKSCFLMSFHNPHDLLLSIVEHHLVVRSPMKYIALYWLYWWHWFYLHQSFFSINRTKTYIERYSINTTMIIHDPSCIICTSISIAWCTQLMGINLHKGMETL